MRKILTTVISTSYIGYRLIQTASITQVEAVSVSFAREILSQEAARKKKTWSTLYREFAKKTSHVPRLHNFQGALSTTDGKTDVGARPAGSWNPIHVSGAWMDACWLAFLIVRISSRTCPPNVFSARVSTLSGTHYQRVLRIRELDRRNRQDGNSSRNKHSRDSTSFLHMLLSWKVILFFYAWMTPIYLNDRMMFVLAQLNLSNLF